MKPHVATNLFWMLTIFLSAALLSSCVPTGPAKGGKTCLDCHAEYKQLYAQGVVHKPVKSGDCAGCHRKHGLIGGAYLKLEEPKLCFSCHQDFGRFLSENRQHHAPVSQGKCSACHQHHNAPQQKLLNLPEEQLCFQCHEQSKFTRA